ncbi:MAG TPA: malonate decarboxylase acyl carrier protein [Casimicrobiaceae bacterium]|nr:malonate decarboxylase acyl carrier protein [Casimicrobiaceae bacterium]
MEKLAFTFDGGKPAEGARRPCIVGVVASGNLEVLIEPAANERGCAIEINTAALGFGTTWQAVMAEFFSRHPLAGVRISINDAGATPAIVSLRLDQAVEAYVRGDG